jgi:phosphoribosylaminoimidazole-succinocarboxamide synthase
MVPSLNSITFDRKGTVAGTDRLRLAISELFWTAVHREGIATCHLARDRELVLLSEERAVPVEVIVKAALVGTPARIYEGLAGRVDRFGRPFAGRHEPYVRFDYRNPLRGPKGEALRDECMPEALADRLIDTREATRNALRIFEIVGDLLARVGFEVWDACFLFDETGRVLCYELSPDNMRVKNTDWSHDPRPTNEFDKDLWRRGADEALIERQWSTLYERLRQVKTPERRDG